MSDPINPEHYKRLPVEAIEIIEAAIANAPSNEDAFLHGQVLKYILRCWNKNGIEDLKKAKWYLDRLVDSFTEQPDLADGLVGAWEPEDGRFKQVYPQQPTKPTLNSDKIHEGYRKLNDSSEEPRQPGDLRWSVAEKRYIPISGDEIGYANRDNWAACRKITGEATGEVTGEATGEVKPPDGWRFLSRGEVIRNGDQGFENGFWYSIEPIMIGIAFQSHWRPIMRRNRFDVGEKVVHVSDNPLIVYTVNGVRADGRVRMSIRGDNFAVDPKYLAPYIEDTK